MLHGVKGKGKDREREGRRDGERGEREGKQIKEGREYPCEGYAPSCAEAPRRCPALRNILAGSSAGAPVGAGEGDCSQQNPSLCLNMTILNRLFLLA